MKNYLLSLASFLIFSLTFCLSLDAQEEPAKKDEAPAKVEEPEKSIEEAYEAKLLETDLQSAEALWKLCQFCSENGLNLKARQHAKAILALDANHKEARKFMGQIKVKGQWVDEIAHYRGKDYCKVGDRWLSPEEYKQYENRVKDDMDALARLDCKGDQDLQKRISVFLKKVKSKNQQVADVAYKDMLGGLGNIGGVNAADFAPRVGNIRKYYDSRRQVVGESAMVYMPINFWYARPTFQTVSNGGSSFDLPLMEIFQVQTNIMIPAEVIHARRD